VTGHPKRRLKRGGAQGLHHVTTEATMIDRNLARGLFLAAFAGAFGIGAMGYSIGNLSHAGPGLFPLMISGLLMLVAVATIIRSRFVAAEKMEFQAKNISLILGSLCAFALASHFVNMTLGIVVMVFLSGFAASSYSVVRNLKVAAGLIAMAFAFHKLLGLNLPLY
jgi:hypothetical protein